MKIKLLIWLLLTAFVHPRLSAQTEWLNFRGMCDASAMEMLTDDLFVVGNDEDNVLRVYSRKKQGFPVQTLDFTSFFALRRHTLEIDLEAAARIGNRIYWISSHGANSKGRAQPSRHRLFATELFETNGVPKLRPVGRLYSSLVRDLAMEPSLASLDLLNAYRKPPKNPGALNIEGLAATPEGHLLIAFRNPIPGKKAVIVRLLNPERVTAGEKPKFGHSHFLDLGGLGVRSLTPYKSGYLIIAGAFDTEGGPSQLRYWDGVSSKAETLALRLDANPEGIAVVSRGSSEMLFLISDDGVVQVDGVDCKKLKDNSLKSFRAYQFPLGIELSQR